MKTTRLSASAAMFVAGATLLVLAGCGGSSNSAKEQSTTAATTTTATGGGTLRVNVSTTDVQSIDPAIDYENTGWAILDATCLKLVNYPDKSGLPGTIVIPEAATALPAVSSDGKAYTFTIRKGFKFNTGEEVTAQTFAHVIDRDLAPALQSPAVTFLSDVVGADAVVNKKATHASGVTVDGDKLTVKLTRVAPDFVARMAMNFFCVDVQRQRPRVHLAARRLLPVPAGLRRHGSRRRLSRIAKGDRFLPRRRRRIGGVVLSDRTIERLLAEGRIEIDPYDPGLLQPSSVDVRVDRYFRVFRNSRYPFIDVKQEQEDLTELVRSTASRSSSTRASSCSARRSSACGCRTTSLPDWRGSRVWAGSGS